MAAVEFIWLGLLLGILVTLRAIYRIVNDRMSAD